MPTQKVGSKSEKFQIAQKLLLEPNVGGPRNCMFFNFVTCLQSGKNRPSRSHKTIIIDNYEVTIFPAESVNHSHTIPAQSAMPSQKYDPEMKLGVEPYSTWFYDLQGKIYITSFILGIYSVVNYCCSSRNQNRFS